MNISIHRRQRTTWQLLAGALIIAAAPSCGRVMHRSQLGDAAAALETNVILRVENHSAAAVTVAAVTGGTWRYVGSVAARSSDSFELYELELNGAPLRLRATLAGRPDAVYPPPLTVLGGQTVTFRIESDPALSSTAVR
jgi:hypothetical protein